MEFNFCRRCGAKLVQTAPTVFVCGNNHTIFDNPIPTAGVFILTEDDKVMLSVRAKDPHEGMLDSFGGFLDGAESTEQAMVRELQEELGLEPDDYETPVHVGSGVGNYPFEGEVQPIVGTFYYTRLKPGVVPIPADDVAAIETVDLDTLDMSRLHDDDIRTGISQLKQALQKEYVVS